MLTLDQQQTVNKAAESLAVLSMPTLEKLAKGTLPPGNIEPASYAFCSFLSQVSTLQQAQLVSAIQAESVKSAALLKSTREAADEMRRDSNAIKRLTGWLVALTVVLAISALPPFAEFVIKVVVWVRGMLGR